MEQNSPFGRCYALGTERAKGGTDLSKLEEAAARIRAQLAALVGAFRCPRFAPPKERPAWLGWSALNRVGRLLH